MHRFLRAALLLAFAAVSAAVSHAQVPDDILVPYYNVAGGNIDYWILSHPVTTTQVIFYDGPTQTPYNLDTDGTITIDFVNHKWGVSKTGLALTTSDISGLGSAATASASSFQGASAALTTFAGNGSSYYLSRSNATGSQTASTISDFGTAALSAVTWSTLTGKPSFATVATSGAYADLSGKPSLATVATSGAYSDLTGKPTLPSTYANPAVGSVTRAFNTPYRPSTTTYPTLAVYTFSANPSVSVTGTSTYSVALQVSANGSTGWTSVHTWTQSVTLSLGVALTITNGNTSPLVGLIPPGYYAQLVPSGTSPTYNSGQEMTI